MRLPTMPTTSITKTPLIAAATLSTRSVAMSAYVARKMRPARAAVTTW